LVSSALILRQDVIARNLAYARSCGLRHVCSYGANAVVVYEPSDKKHGNFLNASYRAIRHNPDWTRRLNKVHSSAAQSLPKGDHRWRELDSCTSSDALLMNVFCHPRTLNDPTLCSTMNVQIGESPIFGFRARVPLANGRADRTEVDMKLGGLLVESKLRNQTSRPDVSKLLSHTAICTRYSISACFRRREISISHISSFGTCLPHMRSGYRSALSWTRVVLIWLKPGTRS